MENSTKTTEKHISKEKLSQLISNGDSSITLQKRKQTDTISKLWIHFSVIHFQKIKQDYVICDSCKSLISYKPATGTGGMQKHVDSCSQISKLLDKQNEPKITGYFQSPKNKSNSIPTKVKDRIRDALTEFVVLDNRPFETVNGAGFMKLMECVLGVGRTLPRSSLSAVDLVPDSRTVRSEFISHIASIFLFR